MQGLLARLPDLNSTAYLVQMFDSTLIRAHVPAAGTIGGSRVRRLRGSFSTKILVQMNLHALLILDPSVRHRGIFPDAGHDGA